MYKRQRGVGRVEALEREGGADDAGALGGREMRIAGQAPGEVQRYGERGTAQPAEPHPVGVQYGYVHTVLEGHQLRGADPLQQPGVGGAAAEMDMLAVVDGQLAGAGVAAEGEDQPAEAGPALDQGDPQPRVGQCERRGGTRETAPDDHRGRALGTA